MALYGNALNRVLVLLGIAWSALRPYSCLGVGRPRCLGCDALSMLRAFLQENQNKQKQRFAMVDILAVWDDLCGYLASVPDVVWSGIVASVITVLGVMVTNWGLSKRHRQQLRHTEEENARKRAHDASESALDRR